MSSPAPLRVLGWPAGDTSGVNPYVDLMYSAFRPPEVELRPFHPTMRRVPKADVFHIQWPEAIFWEGRGHRSPVAALNAWNVLRTARTVRARGGRVVLTLHNLEPHKALSSTQSVIWQRYRRALFTEVDHLVSLSHDAWVEFQKAHPTVAHLPAQVIPHPHYRSCYPPATPREQARAAFGLQADDVVVGMVGTMRPSKHTPQAVQAFLGAAGRERLLLAGGCDDAHWREIESAIGGDPRVVTARGFLSDEDLVAATTSCDVIVLNQTGTLNSGTALLALSMDRPLIAPATGSLRELHTLVGPGWVELFDAPLDGTKLREALDRLLAHPRALQAPLDSLDPQELSRQLLDLFRDLRARTR